MYKLSKILLFVILIAGLTFAFAACGEKDATPPVITAHEQPAGYVQETYTITMATAVDETDGQVDVAVKLLSPDGAELAVSGGTFTPHLTGTYTVVFTAVDHSGNKAEVKKSITVTARQEDAGTPVITVAPHQTTAVEGDVYVLPRVEARDNLGDVPVDVLIYAPDLTRVEMEVGNAFVVDYTGKYTITFTAKGSTGNRSSKTITFEATEGVRTVEGVDGDITDAVYGKASQTYVGGLRGLEHIGVKIARTDLGIWFGFDGSGDKMVSGDERLEIYLDSAGVAEWIPVTAYRFDLCLNGNMICMQGNQNGGSWKEIDYTSMAFTARPVFAVKLGEGTTLESGNSDDNGYTAELFVPYKLLGITAGESFYLSLGCVREGDDIGWDGWNETAVFPDPQFPYRWVECRADGWLFQDNRLYHGDKVDGDISDEKYTAPGAAATIVGGLRNLEGLNVKIARDKEGLYFALDVSGDQRVNDHDRVEIYFNVGHMGDVLNSSRNIVLWLQSNGAMQVLHGHEGSYREFVPAKGSRPVVASKYGPGTTPNDNTDTDAGYTIEVFVPYSLFSNYTDYNVNADTRFGITFGLWRATESFNTTMNWGTDPNKDWDGWSFGEFCDPLYPSTYAVLLADGRIVMQKSLVDEIGTPTDPSVDGVIDESYWQQAAELNIAPTDRLDGVQTLVYRDKDGLRVAFLGDAREITSKDVVVFYVSTKDSCHTIGADGALADAYQNYGRYASQYDFSFRIWLDNSVAVYRGAHKDWGCQIEDLSALSVFINKTSNEHSWVIEMFIPYEFMEAEDGFVPTKDDTLGLSVRLGGENDRGSFLWNNYYFAGLYCDSESPASYVRIDKDNKLFAATQNDGGYRVDGVFEEAVYENSYAEFAFAGANAKLYRGQKGIHARVTFTSADAVQLVFSTLRHGLSGPYVYDFQVTLYKDGTIESSFGNSHDFCDPSINVSYCAPRAVFDGNAAELFISYEWLSRYNTGDHYAAQGWMQIDGQSQLYVAAQSLAKGVWSGKVAYNGGAVTFDTQDPTTYLPWKERESK